MKSKVEYFIYKKIKGEPWPGECWDGPWSSLKRINKAYKEDYDSDKLFQVIKVTYEPAE